jgi:hypothetical protein
LVFLCGFRQIDSRAMAAPQSPVMRFLLAASGAI